MIYYVDAVLCAHTILINGPSALKTVLLSIQSVFVSSSSSTNRAHIVSILLCMYLNIVDAVGIFDTLFIY